jgi:Leucine-rich repeat (LRR) protein
MIFGKLIIFFLSIAYLSSIKAEIPCPFSKFPPNNPCGCYPDDPTSKSFDSAHCETPNGNLPRFMNVPSRDDKYTIRQQLTLSQCGSEIPPQSFLSFKYIGRLNLDQSKTPSALMAQWDPYAFDGVQIDQLSVSGIDGLIPPSLVQEFVELGQKNLTTLSILNTQKALVFKNNDWINFKALTGFHIEFANITDIESDAFAGLEANLQTLILRNVKLTRFPQAIKKLTKLKTLDLSENRITDFPANAFASFTDLQALGLSGNDVQTAINNGAFNHLPPRITNIVAEFGSLTSIPTSIIANSPQLNYLTIKNNLIQSIKKGDFPNGNQLDYVFLDNNPITTIEAQALQTLSYVTRFYLTQSQLTTIDLSTFNGMNKLNYLDISYNQNFKTITISNLDQIPASLDFIKLSDSVVGSISPTVNNLLNRDHFTELDLSNIKGIICDHTVFWMAKPALCEPCLHCQPKLKIYGAKCDDGKTLLSDFLKANVKNPCSTETTTAPPPPPTTTTEPVTTSGTPIVTPTATPTVTPTPTPTPPPTPTPTPTPTTGTPGTTSTGPTPTTTGTGPTTTGPTTTGTSSTQGPTTTTHKGKMLFHFQ